MDAPDQPSPRSPEVAARVLRGALAAAVDRSLASVRRVAVLTGGGLDSAGLLALTVDWARRTGGTVFAVALDFAADGDDRPFLRILERTLGCDVVRVVPEEAASRISLMRGVDAAPFPWPTMPMEIELMARARALGAERVIMGVGGDELFDGDPRALANLVRTGRIVEAVRRARTLRGFERPRSPLASWALRPLAARLQPRALRLHRARRARLRMPVWAGPELVAYLRRDHARHVEASADALDRGEDPSASTKSASARYREYLAWGRHAQGVASGIERVDPYMDLSLIATVRRLPRLWMLHDNRRRGLFREAMRTLLPEAVRLREDKASFEPALVRFLSAGGGPERLRALSSATRLRAHGLVERTAFAEAFEQFVAAPARGEAWTTMWPALCVEAFLREHDLS